MDCAQLFICALHLGFFAFCRGTDAPIAGIGPDLKVCFYSGMHLSQRTSCRVAFFGALFGTWVAGWLLAADWLMHAGVLAKALGLDSSASEFPSLTRTLLRKALPSFAPCEDGAFWFWAVLLAATFSALVAWLAWKFASVARLDRHARAANSIVWVARATLSVRFLLLMSLCTALLCGVIVLKQVTGWSYWTFLPVLAFAVLVGLPIQLCQNDVVQGETLGPWWRLRWPSVPVLLCIASVLTLAWALGALLPPTSWAGVAGWVLAIVVDALVATLLVQRRLSSKGAGRLIQKVLWWSTLRVWFVQAILVVAMLLVIAAPIAGLSYVNIFGVPTLKLALMRAGLTVPQWFTALIDISDCATKYWYVVLIWPLAAWQALLSARLAYMQSQDEQ